MLALLEVKSLANVTYSAAYDSNGMRVEAAGEYKGKPPYYCIGCNEQMIAKNTSRPDRKREKHYAHKSKDPSCSNESILHKDAKRLIAKSIRDEPSYWITVTCGKTEFSSTPCENVLSRMNLAGAEADTERYIVGNRADVLVRTQEGKEIIIAIEVVVHHEATSESRLRYESSHVPVLFVRVESFEDILPLSERIVVSADDYLGELPSCALCFERAREEIERQAREETERREREEAKRREKEKVKRRAREEAERREREEAEHRERAKVERRTRMEAERKQVREEAERQQAREEAERRRMKEEILADISDVEVQRRKERLLYAYSELGKYQIAMGNTNMIQYNKGKQECISSGGMQTCGTPERDCPLSLCKIRYFLRS